MHIEVFDTTDADGYRALQALVARDGKDIAVDKVMVAAAGNGTQYSRGYLHWFTVIYFTLEQAPQL
jgi:hypothetical protein